MKKLLYFIFAVATLSSCSKKVTLLDQRVNMWELVECIEHKDLKVLYCNDNYQPVTATVTGYCDRRQDESQISWKDLYGKIEMHNSDYGGLFLTCTKEKSKENNSLWGWYQYNPIKFYLKNSEGTYCACEIDGKMYEGEGGHYSLNTGTIKAYSSYNGSSTKETVYLSWQYNTTETSYEKTAWYPNGQIKYRMFGYDGYWKADENQLDGGYMKYATVGEAYYHSDGTPLNPIEELMLKQSKYASRKYLTFEDENAYFIMYPEKSFGEYGDNRIERGKVAIVRVLRNEYALLAYWKFELLEDDMLKLYDKLKLYEGKALYWFGGKYIKADDDIMPIGSLEEMSITMYVKPLMNVFDFKYSYSKGGELDNIVRALRYKGVL